MDIADELKANAQNYERGELPNAIFILNLGYFLFGDGNIYTAFNKDIRKLSSVEISGIPDYEGLCLYAFYEIVFELLVKTKTIQVRPSQYFKLPLTAGKYSYQYSWSIFMEMGTCEKHGDFTRSYSPDKLEKVISWCQNANSINWIKAMDIARGEEGNNLESYVRQPAEVRIYNPENLEFSDILLMDSEIKIKDEFYKTRANAYDSIECNGWTIWIPYYYQIKEELVQGCPKCKNK